MTIRSDPIPDPVTPWMEKPGFNDLLMLKIQRAAPSLTVLVGAPFSGKTAIAAKIARAYQQDIGAVVWLAHAGDADPVELKRAASEPDALPTGALLVLDGVTDSAWIQDFIGENNETRSDALPPHRTLITARGVMLDSFVTNPDVLDMPRYSSRRCSRLFETISGTNSLGDRSQSGALKKLVKVLKFMPGLIRAAAKTRDATLGGPLGVLMAIERGLQIDGERID